MLLGRQIAFACTFPKLYVYLIVVSKIPELPHIISTQVRYGVARASKYSRTWMEYNSVTYFCRFQCDFHDCHCSIDHKPPKYFEAPCIRGRGVVPLWLLSFDKIQNVIPNILWCRFLPVPNGKVHWPPMATHTLRRSVL